MKPRFLADADLNRAIAAGIKKREPSLDFKSAQAAALKDREKRGRELEAELERKRAELERAREGLKKL